MTAMGGKRTLAPKSFLTLVDVEPRYTCRTGRLAKFAVRVAGLLAQPFNEVGASSGLKWKEADWVNPLVVEEKDEVISPRSAIVRRHNYGS